MIYDDFKYPTSEFPHDLNDWQQNINSIVVGKSNAIISPRHFCAGAYDRQINVQML